MLGRRNFLKNTVVASTGFIVLPHLTGIENDMPEIIDQSDLENGFKNPPSSARPHAFWMWINGHITKEGITLDLETMKRIGIGGAYIFDTGLGIPHGPVDYGNDEWMELVAYSLKEAERLGLELFLHNAPGFSGTGGSWVTPEMSMQEIVWTEMQVNGNGFIDIELPEPYAKLNYYRDAFVIAFPAPEREALLMKEKLSGLYLDGKKIKNEILLDNNPETGMRIESNNKKNTELLFEFSEPIEARAITITRQPEHQKDEYSGNPDHPPVFHLESSGDGKTFQLLCVINMPSLRFMDAPGAQSFSAVKAKYFRLTSNRSTWLSGVELHTSPRLDGWPGKTNFTDADLTTNNQSVEKEWLIDPKNVIDITGKMQPDGKLKWDAPSSASNWTILRIGHTTTGTRSTAAPDSATGLEIDKFSKETVDFYFSAFLKKLFEKLKAETNKNLKGILIDSWEIGKQNWTKNLPEEFKQRRGYEILSFLPVLTGRIVGSKEETEKFLQDFRLTHADLVSENYYGHFKKRCEEYELLFHAQPNGDGVFDGLQTGQWLDTPMSEFWAHYMPGTINTCKQAISIAHGYGKKIVAAEAFTGLPLTTRWTEYPFALKAQADYFFTQGINKLVFSVFTHQPYSTGIPGMTMAQFGTHFDRNLTWINQSSGWIKYISRTQYLLQQGLPVIDVCYFKGEDPGSGIPDINYAEPTTSKEFTGDVIGPDVLLNRISIKNRRIVLPDGMIYNMLIMAPLKKISDEVIKKIKELLEKGMLLVVSSKPGVEAGTNKIIDELWGNLDGNAIKERLVGKGKIYWNIPVSDVLNQLGIAPDFRFTSENSDASIHYTHRRLGETEIYFISNQLRFNEKIVCSFRVKDMTPEIWNAETGEISEAVLYEFADGRVQMPLQLEPAGSVFIVFRKNTRPQYVSVLKDGKKILTAEPFSLPQLDLYKEAKNDFAIALWLKPDTYTYPGKGVVIFPPEGEIIYGSGHACCGLAAGQNGIRVFERGKGPNRDAKEVINYSKPLEGWTHIALVYTNGRPSLFINGKLAAKGNSSGKIIHPGLDAQPTDERFSAVFEGNHTRPELFNRSLTEIEVWRHLQKGLSKPEASSPIKIKQGSDGKIIATVWQNGSYVLQGEKGNKLLDVSAGCNETVIEGPWMVRFPKRFGAPSEIRLQKLISLHKHPDFNIKHFSGTATWLKTFTLSKRNFVPGQKAFLDLCRVEVVAEIKMNGKYLGVLWKEPFRIDITESILEGDNNIEISVTNLWPNRMIGDEHLPEENKYNDDHIITSLPLWYINNKSKPGRRTSFSVWNNFKKTDPLLESGLLGPVRLLMAVEKNL